MKIWDGMWNLARVEKKEVFFGLVWFSSYRELVAYVDGCGGVEEFRRQNGFLAKGDKVAILRPNGSVKKTLGKGE